MRSREVKLLALRCLASLSHSRYCALYYFPLVLGARESCRCGGLGALVEGKGRSDKPNPLPRKNLKGKVGSFGTNPWA